jgi:hypothetical protein
MSTAQWKMDAAQWKMEADKKLIKVAK